MEISVLHPGNRGVNWCDMESSRFLVRDDGQDGSSFQDYLDKHLKFPLPPLVTYKFEDGERIDIHSRGSQRLVIFPDKPSWIGLDGEVEGPLAALRSGATFSQLQREFHFFPGHLQAFLASLLVKGLIRCDGVAWRYEDDPPLFQSDEIALVELTRGCNIRCKHCFNMSANPLPNELKFNEVCKLIDDILSSRNGVFSSDETIALSGGEPLQHPNILEIIDHVNDLGCKAELLTNGLLLTKEIIKELAGRDVRIRVSLDGCNAKTHEWMRGKGTFQPTIAAIKSTLSAGLEVGITTSVSNHNIDEAQQMVDFVDSLGIDFFQFIIVNHLGRAAKRDMFAGGHAKFYSALFNLADSNQNFRKAMSESTLGNMIACSIAGLFFNHCGLGFQKNYYIQSDGDIFPCRATILPQFKLGNVLKNDFESFDLFEHPTLQKFRKMGVDGLNESCSSCEFRYWCAGDCRGETLQATGDISVVHPSCSDLLEGFEAILWMAISSPEMYFEKSEAFLRRVGRQDLISSYTT